MSRHTMVRAVCLFVFLCILVYSTKQIIGITSIGTRSTAQWNRAIQGENSLAITQTHAIAARNYLESGAGQGLWDKVFFLGDSITFGMQAKRSADEPVTATYTQQFVNALHIPQYTVNATVPACRRIVAIPASAEMVLSGFMDVKKNFRIQQMRFLYKEGSTIYLVPLYLNSEQFLRREQLPVMWKSCLIILTRNIQMRMFLSLFLIMLM